VGFRFRRRIKLFPGVSINLSKSGVSTSIGGKGLTVNLKGGKVKTTASIPGTGLSYSKSETIEKKPAHQDATSQEAPSLAGFPSWVWFWVLFPVFVALLFWL
jgi:hypothetical protein